MRPEIRDPDIQATLPRIQTLALLGESFSPLPHAQTSERLGALGIDRAVASGNRNVLANAGLLHRK